MQNFGVCKLQPLISQLSAMEQKTPNPPTTGGTFIKLNIVIS